VIWNQLRNEDISIVVANSSNFHDDNACDAEIDEIGDDVEVHVFSFLYIKIERYIVRSSGIGNNVKVNKSEKMIFTLKYHNEKNAITTKKYIMIYLLRGSFTKIINPNRNCIAPVIIVEYKAYAI
jgi:hypothetical protein